MQDRKFQTRFASKVWQALVVIVFTSFLALPSSAARKSEDETGKQKSGGASELGASQGRTSAYYHFSLARGLEEDGKFTQALEEYRKAIQQDPQSSELYVELASAYLRHRRLKDAVQEAENAVRLKPDNLEAHKILGQIYYSSITNEDLNRSPASSESLKKAIREFESVARIDPSDTSSFLSLSNLYRYDGQTDKAIETLKKFLEMVPSSEAGLASLAQIYADQGNFKEAIDVFTRALSVNPESPRILEQLAYTYEQSKDYKNAIETYQKALKADEDSLDLRKGLAQALLEDGKQDQAEKEYLRIIEADPDEGLAYMRLGQIYRKRQEFEKALENFNKANSILINSVEVPFYIATLYEELGKFEKAEERFEHLLKLTAKQDRKYSEPEAQNRGIFLTHAGYVAQQLGKYSNAVELFSELKSLSPELTLKGESYIIDTYRTSKQLDKAVAAAEAAMKAHPEEQDLKILYLDVLAESGRQDQAISDLEKMLKGDEDDLKIYSALIQIYQRDKKFKEAEKVLVSAEKYFKNQEAYLFTLGSLSERQKEYDKAEVAFRKILELNPKHAATLNYYGYMLADRDIRLQQSLDLIKQAVALEPNNGAYLDSLGWVYFRLNQFDEAERFLKKALDRVRKDPTIHEHLGDLYYRTGQYQDAQNAWELSVSYHQDEEELRKVQKKLDDLKIKLASLDKK